MTREENDLIKLSRIAFLRIQKISESEKNTREGFQLGIGALNSAETTDLVGLNLLSILNVLVPELKGGLYNDDGLFIIKKPTPRKLEYF